MSTILKALRRLEEEEARDTLEDAPQTSGDARTDAQEPLRARIFAEEAAATALASQAPERSFRLGNKGILAAVTVFGLAVLALGASFFGGSSGTPESSVIQSPYSALLFPS